MKKILLTLTLMLSLLTSFAAEGGDAPTRARSFAWGADVGSSIDLDSDNMTTLNLEAYFGYRNSWIDILGVGAGIDMMISNSNRYFPVYAIFRSSFRSRPSLCFFDLRVGTAINELSDNTKQTRFYINPSLGFNLARSKTFTSYISVGYTYNGLKSFGPADDPTEISHGLNMANLRIGICF